jgi:phospholipid transport system substrate-binding protein
MKSHFWMPLALVLGLGGAAQAQPPMSPYGPGAYGPSARVNPAQEAAAVLREGMDKMLEFLDQDEKPNKLQTAAFLDKEIAPYFNFDQMAKWVAGPRYPRMNEEQRKAMAAGLEARFLSALTGKLTQFKGQQIRILRPRMNRPGMVTVSVGILRPGTYPSKLDFRMYRGKDGWKVYDVVANGRSAVAYYRTELNRSTAARAGVPVTR